jgi:predicted metal-dependent phosphotriesterase family hydrolase
MPVQIGHSEPGFGWTIPFLKQIGVAQQAIHAITAENPRSFFSRS